ncbi:MAG: cytochrome c maturation protein CcmE [Alphaproteobacteria bacterium]|nr:cytochrome c maturation protein CcmE [Alphaproteobacteria bacterium]MBV9371272.1 cytochrome c maturation protein CcmE [Alphaproteobacteria bacterium]MBV9902789.1 cytochrome c maturation protein CcmE [Alphaproteobacteria bacterium]
MKPRNQRLALLLLAAAAMLGAVLLAMSALKDQAAYFYTPGDVARRGVPEGRAVRIGGMVREGSIRRAADGLTIRFTVGDETPGTIEVAYRGIVPDLFKEKSGVVAEGRFRPDGLFVADEILAKHDENYRPPVLDPKTGEHKSKSLR